MVEMMEHVNLRGFNNLADEMLPSWFFSIMAVRAEVAIGEIVHAAMYPLVYFAM
jgi:hypothetical protein